MGAAWIARAFGFRCRVLAGRRATAQDDTWIQGEWNSTNKGVSCCSGGAPFTYNGVWEIAVDGDEIILNEVYASSCSYLAVPHPCFKQGCMQHRMQKVAQNEWRGTLACKPISLTVLSDQRMSHVTTDGRCILTRNTSTVTKHDPHATEKCHVAHDFTKKSALLPSCYSHNTVMIAQIQTTAPGTEGVFLTDMPAALEGKIAPEQWECAMQEAAAQKLRSETSFVARLPSAAWGSLASSTSFASRKPSVKSNWRLGTEWQQLFGARHSGLSTRREISDHAVRLRSTRQLDSPTVRSGLFQLTGHVPLIISTRFL